MELKDKLQELRKQKGLTQEELAQHLFVSRTAVSKWESGRGYPSIDSLKALSKFFAVSIDDLLSGDEVLLIAQEDHKQQTKYFIDRIFALLDCSGALFLFLPFFRQKTENSILEVSLWGLSEIAPYLKVLYFVIVLGIVAAGIARFALLNVSHPLWDRNKNKVSLVLNGAGTFLFIISLQPYPAAFLFIFLLIKVFLLAKKQ